MGGNYCYALVEGLYGVGRVLVMDNFFDNVRALIK